MKPYPTPHIHATPEDFAPTVLMPGDPLRSRFIAENFLENARLVNNVRGVQGYTGTYRGTPVSVMASGMGMPSIGIYSYELYHFFGVRNIIRVGSCGALSDALRVRDLVFGMGASTNSSFAAQYGTGGTVSPLADFWLLEAAVGEAKARGVSFAVGNLLSSDVFYNADPAFNDRFKKMGCLAVEMEAAALYLTAQAAGRRALAICTVSDHIYTGESLDSAARETSFTDMMEVALATAVAAENL